MNKLIKKVVSAVTALAVTLSVAVMFDVPEKISAAAEESHSHKVCVGTAHDGCTHENIEFEPFPDDATTILRGKNYYLTKNIELSGLQRIFVEKGVTNLCLNGYSIMSVKETDGEVIDINQIDYQTAELNICDCKGGGKIGSTSENAQYSCISVIDESTLNIYSGTVDAGAADGIHINNFEDDKGDNKGGTVNIYGGTIQSDNGAAIYIHHPDTALNVYDGKICSSGNNAIYTEGERSTVSICGGEVIGSASDYYALKVSNESSSVTISGGSVIGENYGAVYCQNGTLNVSGGEIIGNASDGYALRVNGEDASANISGGSVIGKNYRAAYCQKGTLNITGGEVKTEDATGTCIYNMDTLVISGGTVSCDGYYAVFNSDGGSLRAVRYVFVTTAR